MDDLILQIKDQNDDKNRKYDKIMFEFYSGDWQNFFNLWNLSFSSNVKKTIEYKIITLRLRVHFAILPIRILQLNQHRNNIFNKSSKVTRILENVTDKFYSLDDEKDVDDEQNKLTIDSMKQLEEFLNSCDQQKLSKKLKNSSYMTFFALPYIVNPQEDESMKNLFSIYWLEELVNDLEKFLNNFLKEEISKYDQVFHDGKKLSENEKTSQSSTVQNLPLLNNFSKKKECDCEITEAKNELKKHNKDIHSVIKNKDIQNWITGQQHMSDENILCTKSTQTYLSSIKAGTDFLLVDEPQQTVNTMTPSIFLVPTKQPILDNDELKSTKSKLFSVYRHYRKLRSRFHQLHEDYQKMNEIAEELTIALENSVKGQPVNLDTIMQSCVKIFPDRFNRDIQTDSECTSIDMKEDLSNSIIIPKEEENIVNNSPVPPKSLDYQKIKFYLKNGSVKTKLLLLQALRQKLTLTKPEHRNETVSEYINNDLLGLWKNSSDINESEILPYILQPINLDENVTFIQQTTSRLLNALASLKAGRNYLTSNPIVLNSIIRYLDSCNNRASDVITLDMLIATLQKMSLRKQQRHYMIEANLVEWLIHHLNNENFRMRMYRLEYTCALLMNLSLQSSARSRASLIAPLFNATMISLLSFDCTSILPYINGVLQNFLLNDEINEEAKKFHLAEVLEFHRSKNVDEIRNHFSHTLKIHKRECDDYLSDDDEFPDEDDEIFDILEKELEENDPIKMKTSELQGDQLLTFCYSLPSFLLESSNFDSNKTIEKTNLSIDEFISRESNETESKTMTNAREIILDDLKTETLEKKRTTAVATTSKKVTSNHDSKEEEKKVFSAKPKIIRTPPSSTRKERAREKSSKRM